MWRACVLIFKCRNLTEVVLRHLQFIKPLALRDANTFSSYFMKYLWPLAVVLISHPGGIGVGSSSKAVLSKEVDLWWWTPGLKEWFGGPFRVVGTVSDAGDERECEWEIGSLFGTSWSGDKLPSIGGCLKNDGGSFLNRIGNDCDDAGSGCVFATEFLLMTWKSASRSLSESCLTCTTQLLFFLSIASVFDCLTRCAQYRMPLTHQIVMG